MNTPLVMLHGWGLNRCIWDTLRAELRQEHTTFALDLPGYAGAALQPYDLGSLAADVLDSAPEAAIWIGSSLGGMVALQAALLCPQRITTLVLVGVTPRFVNDSQWWLGTDPQIFARFAADLEMNYDKSLQRFLLLLAGCGDQPRTFARTLAQSMRQCGRPAARVLEDGLRCLEQADLRPHLSEVRCPVHVIQGRSDQITPPAAAEFLVANLPDAELNWMDAGHLPFVSHPQEFLDIVQKRCN